MVNPAFNIAKIKTIGNRKHQFQGLTQCLCISNEAYTWAPKGIKTKWHNAKDDNKHATTKAECK